MMLHAPVLYCLTELLNFYLTEVYPTPSAVAYNNDDRHVVDDG